jgi:3-hydroxyisobutyrate dehydrogenase
VPVTGTDALDAAVVGLGRMGAPLARRLIASGHRVWVCDRDRRLVDALVSAGASPATDAAAAADRAATVLVMVADDTQVREVVTGPAGALLRAAPGTTIVVHSTVHPGTCRDLAAAARDRDVDLIDAPVSGGPPGAADGTLTAMVGGDPTVIDRCRPLLATYCAEVIAVGPVGSGQVAKLSNNVMSLLNTVAAFEALALAESCGLDARDARHIAAKGSGASRALETWDRRAALARPDSGGQRRLAAKDLDIALALAAEAGLDMPLTALAYRRLLDVPDDPEAPP